MLQGEVVVVISSTVMLLLPILCPLVQEENSSREKYAQSRAIEESVQFIFGFYDQIDKGGDPSLNEEVTILQPMLLWNMALSETWGVSLKLQSDLIFGSSDSQSGASRKSGTSTGGGGGDDDDDDDDDDHDGFGWELSETYFLGNLGITYNWSGQTTLGMGFRLSTEDGYGSIGGNLQWIFETEDQNDAFSVNLTGYFDTLDVELFDGTNLGKDHRNSTSIGLGWTHILGESTLGTVNYDVTLQDGFLGTPSHSVLIGESEFTDNLPGSRTRHALYIRLRHLLIDPIAVEPAVGFYTDDWGADAFNLEFSLFWEIIPKYLLLRPSYRFHSQTEIDHFVPPNSPAIPKYRTQDSDLGEFDSHTIGLKITLFESPLLGEEFSLMMDYSTRSDGISWYMIAIGFTWN